MVKHPNRTLVAALAVAWVFDFLFWGKSWGISFAIFVALCIAVGLSLARLEGVRPSPRSLWLLAPIAFFAIMSFIRLEPMTVFLDRVATLLLMALLAGTLTGGRWMKYSLGDYLLRLLGVTGGALSQAGAALAARPEEESEARAVRRRRVVGVVRGLMLALPVIIVFAALLTSADPIFSQKLEDFLEFFNIEDLAEYLWRAFIIMVIAYLLGGVFIHALTKSDDEKLVGIDKPWLSPFLGYIEAAVVLGAVVLLFASFVAVQFRYFFGGSANIHIDGYTYAEYARRGFGELVMVAFFSLLLFLGLSAVTKRAEGRQQNTFSGLGIAMVLLVGVILTSAFQRLFLYESAYGFSRMRTYPHVFMIWLGALLLAVVVLELLGRQRSFALAAVAAATGFVVTLNLLNVDAFIARANIDRILNGGNITASSRGDQPLDASYLATLSADATPALVEAFKAGGNEHIDEIGFALGCNAAWNDRYAAPEHWQSFNVSRALARQAWESVSGTAAMKPYLAKEGDNDIWYIVIKGEERDCWNYNYGWD